MPVSHQSDAPSPVTCSMALVSGAQALLPARCRRKAQQGRKDCNEGVVSSHDHPWVAPWVTILSLLKSRQLLVSPETHGRSGIGLSKLALDKSCWNT